MALPYCNILIKLKTSYAKWVKMNIKDRMHRFNRIKIEEAPSNILTWFPKQHFIYDRTTIFLIRNMLYIDQDNRDKVQATLKNQLSKEEKEKSNMILHSLKNEKSVDRLIDMYELNEYKAIEVEIIRQMLFLDENAYRFYLNLLKTKYTNIQFDHVFQVLVEAMKIKNISEEILSILKEDFVRDPEDFASLIQVLGLADVDNSKYLYSFYNYFKDNFPSKDYFEGPLYGFLYAIGNNVV